MNFVLWVAAGVLPIDLLISGSKMFVPGRRLSPWAKSPPGGCSTSTRASVSLPSGDLTLRKISCVPGGTESHEQGHEQGMVRHRFVTGSSRGLGREFVKAALSRGDRVAATARTTDGFADLVAAHGDAILPLPMDVTGRAAVFEAVQRAHGHFGWLDVVMSNTGYAQIGAVEELAEKDLRDQLEANRSARSE